MFRIKSTLALLITLLIAGCSTTPEGLQPGAQVEDRTTSARGTSSATSAGASSTGTSSASNLNATPIAPAINVTPNVVGRGDPALRDPKSLLSQRGIYFDYDGFVVGPDYKALLEAHAKYLLANRAARMRIEGNTDERGSREYNLALGQRRADAVKRALTILGASDAQIETVSFGEEKPRAVGSAEENWRENRRADIVYAGE